MLPMKSAKAVAFRDKLREQLQLTNDVAESITDVAEMVFSHGGVTPLTPRQQVALALHTGENRGSIARAYQEADKFLAYDKEHPSESDE